MWKKFNIPIDGQHISRFGAHDSCVVVSENKNDFSLS